MRPVMDPAPKSGAWVACARVVVLCESDNFIIFLIDLKHGGSNNVY